MGVQYIKAAAWSGRTSLARRVCPSELPCESPPGQAELGHVTGHRHWPICGMSRAAAGKANDSEQKAPDDVPPLVPTRGPLEEESKLSASAREGEAELARSPGGSNRHIMTTRCEPSQPDPFPTAAVRGCHILTRKEYLANFEGDTAGWAPYQEDQYYAERGVSLTADAEERLKTNTWETLGQAKARLFDTRVRSPNNRPTKLSKEANDARARRRRESRLLSQ